MSSSARRFRDSCRSPSSMTQWRSIFSQQSVSIAGSRGWILCAFCLFRSIRLRVDASALSVSSPRNVHVSPVFHGQVYGNQVSYLFRISWCWIQSWTFYLSLILDIRKTGKNQELTIFTFLENLFSNSTPKYKRHPLWKEIILHLNYC